jgi:hypothetical protein
LIDLLLIIIFYFKRLFTTFVLHSFDSLFFPFLSQRKSITMSESAAAAAAEAASTAMPQSDNAEVDEIAKAGVKVAAYMVTLALTVLPGIIIAILAFVAFFKIKRRGDHARAGVPWFKAAGGLACLYVSLRFPPAFN